MTSDPPLDDWEAALKQHFEAVQIAPEATQPAPASRPSEPASRWAELGLPESYDGEPAPDSTVADQANQPPRKRTPIPPRPFAWRAPFTIPRRAWIYAKHLVRGCLSCTVAPGGTGKSLLAINEALAIASGRPLLGHKPSKRHTVWLYNLEDSPDEIDRRVAAAMLHHRIDAHEVGGRLFLNSRRDKPITLASQTNKGVEIAEYMLGALVVEIRDKGIEVLIIDPFVGTHTIPENDNTSMDKLARGLAMVAEITECAIDVVHHTRKTGGAEITVEDSRGASALINAARSVRTLNRMSLAEAGNLGIAQDDRFRFFRVDRGKSNLAPPAIKADWFKLESVGIGNGREDDPDATQDYVGVVTRYTPTDPLADITPETLLAVQQAIAGKQFRESVQSPQWAGYAIAEELGLDPTANKARLKTLISSWLKTGALRLVLIRDAKGRLRPAIDVGTWANGHDHPEQDSPP